MHSKFSFPKGLIKKNYRTMTLDEVWSMRNPHMVESQYILCCYKQDCLHPLHQAGPLLPTYMVPWWHAIDTYSCWYWSYFGFPIWCNWCKSLIWTSIFNVQELIEHRTKWTPSGKAKLLCDVCKKYSIDWLTCNLWFHCTCECNHHTYICSV